MNIDIAGFEAQSIVSALVYEAEWSVKHGCSGQLELNLAKRFLPLIREEHRQQYADLIARGEARSLARERA